MAKRTTKTTQPQNLETIAFGEPVRVVPNLNGKGIQEIDAETWAESGGTGGIFGRLHRAGKLRIVPTVFED